MSKTSFNCRGCGAENAVWLKLDAGAIPISNAYLAGAETIAPTKPLLVGECLNCLLLQLCEPFTDVDLADQIPAWIRYKEPEGHLDALAEQIRGKLPVGTKDGRCFSYIDESLLERLELDATSDDERGIEPLLAETVGGVSPSSSDLILARHVLDHARDLGAFLAHLKDSLTENGLICFEVPDSRVYLNDSPEHLMLWESHANYFTPASLRNVLVSRGFAVESCEAVTADSSHVIVALCRRGEPSTERVSKDFSADAFANDFANRKTQVRSALERVRNEGKTIAMVGGGHIGSLFLNLFDVGDLLEFVVDDDPQKVDLRLPGSGLEIFPSEAVVERGIGFLLMSVNQHLEPRVIERFHGMNPDFAFGSIFRSSDLAV